jgi:hypothetical protein
MFLSTGWGLLGSTAARAQSSAAATAGAGEASAWQQDLSAWRAQREREISAPDGWLTLAGLEWLKPGINSVGAGADNRIRLHAGAPERLGLLTVSGQTVQLLSPAGGFPAELTIDGKPAREGPLTVDNAKPSTIAWRGMTLVVLKRGDRFVLRVKDAESAARKSFHGLNWFAPDPRYRITARWVPFCPRRGWPCLCSTARSGSWSLSWKTPRGAFCSSSCATRPARPRPTVEAAFCIRNCQTTGLDSLAA